MNNYVICTVQRSGKSWIAETLNMLGLGYGIELLTEFHHNTAPEQDLLQAAFDSGGMYCLAKEFARNSLKARAPCASITLQWSDFDAKDDFEIINHQHRSNKLNALIDGLSPCNVFFLRRKDMLSQAISHFLANESSYYHSTCSNARRPQRACVRYDRTEIERYLIYTQRCYAEWSHLFTIASVTPATLYYEDFVDDPIQSFGNLADRIAGRSFKPEAITAASACYSKVSDDTDNAFRARYLGGE